MKLHTAMPKPYGMKMKMNIDSERFFNDPKHVKNMEDMGVDVDPVDVFKGYVPTGKGLDQLKKTEQHIRDRFDLNAGGDEE